MASCPVKDKPDLGLIPAGGNRAPWNGRERHTFRMANYHGKVNAHKEIGGFSDISEWLPTIPWAGGSTWIHIRMKLENNSCPPHDCFGDFHTHTPAHRTTTAAPLTAAGGSHRQMPRSSTKRRKEWGTKQCHGMSKYGGALHVSCSKKSLKYGRCEQKNTLVNKQKWRALAGYHTILIQFYKIILGLDFISQIMCTAGHRAAYI